MATSKVLAGASNEAYVTDEESFGSGEVSDARRFLDEIFSGCVFGDGICPIYGGGAVAVASRRRQSDWTSGSTE